MSDTSRQSGFTIVELMVTLAVAAILMGFAVPAFNDFVRQRTLTSGANDMLMAITYARSEAVRRGGQVSVQALGGGGGNEWGDGWCVVVGNPGSCAAPAEVLRRFEGLDPAEFTLDGTGGLDGLSTLSFNGRGLFTAGVVGGVEACHVSEDPGRRIDISLIGRAEVSELECHP